jgi:hypothetical protein
VHQKIENRESGHNAQEGAESIVSKDERDNCVIESGHESGQVCPDY